MVSGHAPVKLRRTTAPTALAFVLAAFAPGCGGLGDSYVVRVDPRFTREEQAKIVAALDSWEAAVPVHFAVEIASCSGIHGGTICIHASDYATIAARQSPADGAGLGLTLREKSWGQVVDGGEIFVDVPTVEGDYAADFQRIATRSAMRCNWSTTRPVISWRPWRPRTLRLRPARTWPSGTSCGARPPLAQSRRTGRTYRVTGTRGRRCRRGV